MRAEHDNERVPSQALLLSVYPEVCTLLLANEKFSVVKIFHLFFMKSSSNKNILSP